MSDINKLNSFKNITLKDNIFVKEGNGYKKSNFAEIGDTLIKYIDIDEIINEVISRRDDFLEVFKQRGIYPIIRMNCNVVIKDIAEKKVSLVQKPLSINGQNRYKDIPEDYISKGILEVFIEKLPAEINNNDRKNWRVVDLDSPIFAALKKEKTEAPTGDIMLSDFILSKPTMFSFTIFNQNPCWLAIKDTFPGRVEAYGSSTGVDGYLDYSNISDAQSYLRFINSTYELDILEENISRSKIINLQGNNIMVEKYVEEDPNSVPNNTLIGKDLEMLASTSQNGFGADSLGIKLVHRPEVTQSEPFRPGQHEIGNIRVSFNPAHFGIKEFEEGLFVCAAIDSDKVYNSSDFPVFVKRFNVQGSTFTVKDYLYKLKISPSIPESKFSSFRLGYTDKSDEMGVIVHGKFNFSNQYAPKGGTPSTSDYALAKHVDKSSSADILSGIDKSKIKYAIPDPNGVSVIDYDSLVNNCIKESESFYQKRSDDLSFIYSSQPQMITISNKPIQGKSRHCIFYVIVGFKI